MSTISLLWQDKCRYGVRNVIWQRKQTVFAPDGRGGNCARRFDCVNMTDDKTKMQMDVRSISRTHTAQAIRCCWWSVTVACHKFAIKNKTQSYRHLFLTLNAQRFCTLSAPRYHSIINPLVFSVVLYIWSGITHGILILPYTMISITFVSVTVLSTNLKNGAHLGNKDSRNWEIKFSSSMSQCSKQRKSY